MIQDKSGRDIFTPREELSALIWEWQKWYGEDYDEAIKEMRKELQTMKNLSVSQTMTPPSQAQGWDYRQHSPKSHDYEAAKTALPLRIAHAQLQDQTKNVGYTDITETIQRLKKQFDY
jgi:uncharacterized protein YcaQ